MKITGKLKTDASRHQPKPVTQPPSRAARMLALAYLIERKIDAGEIESYAAAARLLGTSRARVTQIIRLLQLPSEIQQEILLGKIDSSCWAIG